MLRVTAAVIEKDGRVLIARRRRDDRFGGVWEFPGGKLEAGESPEEGLRREIEEELGIAITVGPALGAFPFVSPEWSIELLAFRAAWTSGELVCREHDEIRWAAPAELRGFDFAEPDRPIVRLLAGLRTIPAVAEHPAGVVLHPGKDKAVRNHHPWIFSGAVRSRPQVLDGDILPVYSADGEFLGSGYFNSRCSIIGRLLTFDRTPPLEALEGAIVRAVARRKAFFDERTTGFRLINGEGDDCPGLVADDYAGVLVVQFSTLGMDRLKEFVLDVLERTVAPRAVYEKSNLPSRREEGLPQGEAWLRGEPVPRVEILEDGLRYIVDIPDSQKTGFYLDQREMRRMARDLARGRRVLNAFSYTGGFTVAALAGGAVSADSVDVSARAVALAAENVRLNGFDGPGLGFHTADVFEFLRIRPLDYDLVVLDPPAFAKRKAEVVAACRGYKDIHRLVFQKVPPGALLLTFSCSHFVDETLFRQVVFQAAREAGRGVRILQRHRQALDHPVNIYHPESEYLKGFLLSVD